MGWCSATEIFDTIVTSLTAYEEVDKETIIKELIISLENSDWDCQQDSIYWDHPLVRKCFKATSPELFEE